MEHSSKVFSVISEKREMVNKVRAEEFASSAKEQTDFEEIQLSTKSFGLDAAQVLAELFNKFTKVKRVYLNDCIAGRPEEEALKVLEILCNSLKHCVDVTEINLSDNALGRKGITACKSLLEEKENLQKLSINNNGLAPDAAELLAELLLFRTPTKLELLHCYNNLLVDGGAAAFKKILAASPNLVDVRFSATRFTKTGGLHIAEGLFLSGTTHLTRIDLSDNSFGGKASEFLSKLLQNQPNLTYLHLGDTSLTDDDLFNIASSFTSSNSPTKLHTLILCGNDFTSKAAKLLVSKILPKLSNLKLLRLEENELGSSGVKILAKFLKSGLENLEELNLATNSIGQAAGLALVQALKSKKTLKIIKLE